MTDTPVIIAKPPRAPAPGSGNRCGHAPGKPVLVPAEWTSAAIGKHPLLIRKAVTAFKGYYDRPDMFPDLNDFIGIGRQQRSERREAIVLLMSAILRLTDITTLTVGAPAICAFTGKRVIKPVTGQTLANHAGLSFSRAMRALAVIKRAAIITCGQQRERTTQGGYKGLPAVRAIDKKFFAVLGLQEMLDKEREKRSRKKYGRAAKETITEAARRLLSIKARNPAQRSLKNNIDDKNDTPQISRPGTRLRPLIPHNYKPPGASPDGTEWQPLPGHNGCGGDRWLGKKTDGSYIKRTYFPDGGYRDDS